MVRWGAKRLTPVLAVLFALTLVLAACGGGSETGGSSDGGSNAPAQSDSGGGSGDAGGGGSSGEEPLVLGFMGRITGDYASWGVPAYNAAVMAAEEWNEKGGLLGQPIEIEPYDAQADPTQAATLANKLIDEGIPALIGPTFSSAAEATVPILSKVPIPSITGLADLIDPNGAAGYFRISPREDNAAAFGVRLTLEYLKAERIAVIDDGQSVGVTMSGLVIDFLKEKGVEPVYTGSITTGQNNYAPTLTKVKSLNPDAIILTSVLPETAILRKQATELGLDVPIVNPVDGNDGPQFKEIAGAAGTKTFVVKAIPDEDRFDTFRQAYEERFNEEIGNANEYTYDAANVLFTAIDNAGSTDANEVIAALKAIKDFPGVTGPITFDSTGSRGTEVFVAYEFTEGQEWSEVEDVPFNTP